MSKIHNEIDMSTDQKKAHPYKFILWVGLGSIIMLFAGLTSAYIVKKGQSNWLDFELPVVFWYSTLVIVLSSVTMQMALKKFKEREMGQYRGFITLTVLLGLVFVATQIMGFSALEANSIALTGPRSNSASSFLLVIAGLHILHVVGGVIALAIIFLRAYSVKTKFYNALPVELASIYWHFVDILWIYLFVFLQFVG